VSCPWFLIQRFGRAYPLFSEVILFGDLTILPNAILRNTFAKNFRSGRRREIINNENQRIAAEMFEAIVFSVFFSREECRFLLISLPEFTV